ncbi:DNA polymerase III subunit delta, partial [Candidatus Pelagibacter sp.]|nr:DNA polymerase III subunit delta [Candidatus Pelagibacter sp.]
NLENVFKPNFSANIYHYDENQIITNVEDFKERVFNKSFFDNEKLLIISRASDKILSLIEEIIDKNIEDLKIILKTGILDKKSKLRKFFEKTSKGIIVPYYDDNYQTLSSLAQNFFKDKKIKISSQNINFIVERSKGDRINFKNELEKIANYSHKKLSIDLDEVLKLTNLIENYDVSYLADQCLAKNKKKTLNILNENNPSSEDNILILKTFLYKLKRLKKLKIVLETEKNTDIAITSYRPPIFWKDKDIVKQQLKIWSLSQIQTLIKNVNDLELLVKKNSHISNYLINNFILEKSEIISN